MDVYVNAWREDRNLWFCVVFAEDATQSIRCYMRDTQVRAANTQGILKMSANLSSEEVARLHCVLEGDYHD